MNIVSM